MSTRQPARQLPERQSGERESVLQEAVTFVVPVSDAKILERNFLSSPCLSIVPDYQFLPQANFPSAARAYNDAIDKSSNDLIIFAHQDVLFPRAWLSHLGRAIADLDRSDSRWGVLGCWGATKNGSCVGNIYSTGLGVLGRPFDHPIAVHTLDEIVLVFRKSSQLRFTEALPGFHFYGADICLAASTQGRTCYAISAFCVHNTNQLVVLPSEFYRCYREFRKIWRRYLPVQTTCIRVSRAGLDFPIRRMKDLRLSLSRPKRLGGRRVDDPNQLLSTFD